MGIYEDIRKGQEQSEGLIKKSLPTNINEVIEDIKKAKALPDGTIKEWGGKKYKKSGGQWRPVGKGSNSSKEGESEGSDTAEPVDLSEHAKNASEGALLNATKTSNDPKIREAAHKELMRRKNEEAGETFKAPEEGGEKAPEKKTAETPVEKVPEKKESLKSVIENKGQGGVSWKLGDKYKLVGRNGESKEEKIVHLSKDEMELADGTIIKFPEGTRDSDKEKAKKVPTYDDWRLKQGPKTKWTPEMDKAYNEGYQSGDKSTPADWAKESDDERFKRISKRTSDGFKAAYEVFKKQNEEGKEESTTKK